MTAVTQRQSSSEARPTTLNAAIVLLLINAFAPYPFLPTINGLDGFIIGVTIAFSVLFTAGAWGLWMHSKKAGIAMIVVSAINLVLSFGTIFSAPKGSPDAVDVALGIAGTLVGRGNHLLSSSPGPLARRFDNFASRRRRSGFGILPPLNRRRPLAM